MHWSDETYFSMFWLLRLLPLAQVPLGHRIMRIAALAWGINHSLGWMLMRMLVASPLCWHTLHMVH